MTLDHLASLRDESARFLAVLSGADLTHPVPSCPDWSAADLLWHLGEVQWFWASIVAGRLRSPDSLVTPDRPASDHALVRFFEEQSSRLLTALTEADPAAQVHMWASDKSVGYVRRRQAHEALIHRLDAELAVAEPTPLDPVLATDGVEEVLGVMYGDCPSWGTFAASPVKAEVRAVDTGVSWGVAVGRFTGTDPDSGTEYDEGALSLSADPALAPAVTISGTAEDLDAWLWHRRDASRIQVVGDPAARDRLLAVLAQPIT